jgi:hypothetical protein
MAEQTYEGSCHCGAVAYAAKLDFDQPVISCNCSHCQRKGFLLAFLAPDAFDLKQGREALSEYRFNKEQIAHLFCATCGVQSFAEGKGPGGAVMVAVNVRCLEGVDPDGLTLQKIDGASF